jgi:hypothetical protein
MTRHSQKVGRAIWMASFSSSVLDYLFTRVLFRIFTDRSLLCHRRSIHNIRIPISFEEPQRYNKPTPHSNIATTIGFSSGIRASSPFLFTSLQCAPGHVARQHPLVPEPRPKHCLRSRSYPCSTMDAQIPVDNSAPIIPSTSGPHTHFPFSRCAPIQA